MPIVMKKGISFVKFLNIFLEISSRDLTLFLAEIRGDPYSKKEVNYAYIA